MIKTKFICLLLFGLAISSSFAWAALPNDYTISYTFKNPDGTVFRIIKYYMLDGSKFRSEYYSSQVEYNMSASVEASTDLGDSVSTTVEVSSDGKMGAENLPTAEPHTVEILRHDKKLVWSMEPSYKQFIEVPLREESWERASMGNFLDRSIELKKTGGLRILNYDCDIYENIQMVQENTWKNIFYVAKDLDIVLKTEMWQNDKLVQTMEAIQFSTDKPVSSLFEVPEGYQKNENN